MKIRNGFVSNSSSSSYIIQYFINLPKLPKNDDKLYDLFIGNDIQELEEHLYYNYNLKKGQIYPIHKKETIKEIKKILKTKKRIKKPTLDFKKAVIKDKRFVEEEFRRWSYYNKEDFFDRTDEFIKNSKSDEERKGWIVFKKRHEQIRDIHKNTLDQYYQEYIKEFDFNNLYLIEDTIEIDENMEMGRYPRPKEINGKMYIDPSTIPFNVLFKKLNKETMKWTIWTDQHVIDDEYNYSKKEVDQVFKENKI